MCVCVVYRCSVRVRCVCGGYMYVRCGGMCVRGLCLCVCWGGICADGRSREIFDGNHLEYSGLLGRSAILDVKSS